MFSKFVFACLAVAILFLAVPVFAGPIDNSGNGPYLGVEYGKYTSLGKTDVRVTMGKIIQVVLGLLGTIAVALIVYAGFKWMTAAGNEEAVGEAKKILYSAVIGLVIILSAYSIVRFVLPQLFIATTGITDYSTVEQGF